jgi:hypothetical protein
MQQLSESGLAKGFEVESGHDYGAGPIDIVWKIPVHPGLPDLKCGFVLMRADEGGNQDTQDNQFSVRKVEEAVIRGLRSGMDKTYLVTENKDIAKSVSGQIEWLASHGSLLRRDSIAQGISPSYHGPTASIPSQKRVPKGEKIRKRVMRNRESKLNKYNRPKRKSSFQKDVVRESRIDRNSRPRSQIPKRSER